MLAHEAAEAMGLSKGIKEEVSYLILITRHSSVYKKGNKHPRDRSLICDIDLSIWGKSREEFASYEEKIRKEYFWVSDLHYRKKRIDILITFMDRLFIYSTAFFRERYEAQARRNLRWSLARLHQH